MANVVPTHLFDRELRDFGAISASGDAQVGGDIAFDDEPCASVPESGAIRLEPAG
jgi:tRNA 2-thiocytidine biosynthesis protein TtcA